MEHQHYTHSPQFRRILKEWDSSIGKETYFTIENYKANPTCFPLYNITYPNGIRETDTVLNFQIRCPHCHTIHTCHVPDQSNEVEYLAQFYTTCTQCQEIFHLLSNFINEEVPTRPNQSASKATAKNKADIITGILILILYITATIITAPYAGTSFGDNLIINTLRLIAGFYLAINILYSAGIIIALNYGHYEAPKSWTMRGLLAPACLFWYSPLIIYHFIKHLRSTFKKYTLKNILRPFPLTVCALLGIAAFDLSYGYYQFLRIVLSIWGISGIIQANKEEKSSPGKTAAIIISSGILILYNPLIPIHLDRENWLPLNLISIPLILLTTYLTQSKPQS